MPRNLLANSYLMETQPWVPLWTILTLLCPWLAVPQQRPVAQRSSGWPFQVLSNAVPRGLHSHSLASMNPPYVSGASSGRIMNMLINLACKSPDGTGLDWLLPGTGLRLLSGSLEPETWLDELERPPEPLPAAPLRNRQCRWLHGGFK